MWLTGFDAPSLHTMYVDKPMRGHGLMQAIARVNRVFKDKPGGLVVDYLGLADELKQALATYTESGGTGQDRDRAGRGGRALCWRNTKSVCGLFHGFDWSLGTTGTPQETALAAAGSAGAHPRAGGRQGAAVASRDRAVAAFALAVPHDEALRIRDDVGFFQAVRAALVKAHRTTARPPKSSITPSGRSSRRRWSPAEVVDIFAAAGLKKPDISILSDEFLAEVRGMPQRNLAVELLRKLLIGEIKTRSRHNVVQARSFTELLEQSMRRYQNRAIETAQVIEELIALAKDMRAANERGEELGLSEDELAFYDALETNDSAVKVLGEPTLEDDRPRAGRDGAQECDDRLDLARKRPRSAARARQAHPPQIRLSARQAGESDANRLGAGGAVLGSLGNRYLNSREVTTIPLVAHAPARG